jgi:hypothetical protein
VKDDAATARPASLSFQMIAGLVVYGEGKAPAIQTFFFRIEAPRGAYRSLDLRGVLEKENIPFSVQKYLSAIIFSSAASPT